MAHEEFVCALVGRGSPAFSSLFLWRLEILAPSFFRRSLRLLDGPSDISDAPRRFLPRFFLENNLLLNGGIRKRVLPYQLKGNESLPRLAITGQAHSGSVPVRRIILNKLPHP
ncbi:MAG TPA: hypothetical protein PLQ88_26340 [Blastocatellia bacterium]|nr:hypothetical protein [Blastocatellia bacterium]